MLTHVPNFIIGWFSGGAEMRYLQSTHFDWGLGEGESQSIAIRSIEDYNLTTMSTRGSSRGLNQGPIVGKGDTRWFKESERRTICREHFKVCRRPGRVVLSPLDYVLEARQPSGRVVLSPLDYVLEARQPEKEIIPDLLCSRKLNLVFESCIWILYLKC